MPKSPSTAGHDEIRERLAELLAKGDADAVQAMFDELATQRDELATQRDELAETVTRRDETIEYLRRLAFGRRSERLTAEELGQLVLAYGGTAEGATTSDPQIPIPERSDAEPEEEPRGKPKKRRRGGGRTKLSPDLERHVEQTLVPEAERCCHTCGEQMAGIGFVEHERVEYVTAKLVVHVERREKLVCKTKGCHSDATTAERTQAPLFKTRVGASLLAHLIESKCDDGLPIHRQRDKLARLGFEIPVETLYGYWRYATDLLLPVSDALLGTILADPVVVALDDTGIDVLDRHRKGGKCRGHLWCFRGSGKLVALAFTESWHATRIAPWIQLISPETHIQVDDYKGYGFEVEYIDGTKGPLVPIERRLGCMMHVRRRFHAAFKLGDKRAALPLGLIKKIYEIEKRARGMPPPERHALRQEESLPLLDKFDQWVDDHADVLGKTGKLAEAVRYAKHQRPYIRRCFTDGRFEIDNGAVERSIRKPAVGRKNFLFTGSANAARRLAGAYSLVLTCRELGISTRDYLIDVLVKIEGGWPMRRLVELLPHNWAAVREKPSEPA